jgi:hypothetical protein
MADFTTGTPTAATATMADTAATPVGIVVAAMAAAVTVVETAAEIKPPRDAGPHPD